MADDDHEFVTVTKNKRSSTKTTTGQPEKKKPLSSMYVDQGVLPMQKFLYMSRMGVHRLADGPMISITYHGSPLGLIPRRLLMAFSPVANDALRADQASSVFSIPKNCRSPGAASVIIGYWRSILKTGKFFSLPWFEDVKKNALVYQTAVTLGLQPFFGHFLGYLVSSVHTKDGILDYEDLDAVLRSSNDASNPVFVRYARIFASLRYEKQIPDIMDFNKWIDNNHPTFARAMNEIDTAKHAQFRVARTVHRGQGAAGGQSGSVKQEVLQVCNNGGARVHFNSTELVAVSGGNQNRNIDMTRRGCNNKKVIESVLDVDYLRPGVHTISADAARSLGKRPF